MRRLVELLVGDRRGADTVVECRNCGASVAESADCCPECDSESIATYEIG